MESKGTINILMVDDRPENLLALEAVLAAPNYNLIAANSGEEALKNVLREDFAVILLDVQMPVLNGFETAKLIKAREKSKHVPIIFITAISQATEHVNFGYGAGAIDYLFKPFNPEVLKKKIEGFVQLYEYRKELELANEKLRKTSLELRKAEGLARIISDISADTIVTCNEQGKITSINPAVSKMFGYDPQELLGEPFNKLLPLINNDENGLIETIGRRKDATEFPAEIQIGKANYENQNILVLSVRDITERKLQYSLLEKLVEERTLELQQSNSRVIDILESITDGFFAFDKEWRFTYVNKEAESLVAIVSHEVLGKCLWEVFPEVNSLFHKQAATACRKKTAVHFETRLPGGSKWLEFHIYPFEEGFSVYFRDISQRKKDEEEIRVSQERFSKIFNASPDLISIRRQSDMRYLDANKIWLDSLGFAKVEIIGKTFLELNLSKEKKTIDIVEKFSREKNIDSEKVFYLTRSGEERVGLISTELIELNNELCILSVIKDITKLERMEYEIARLDRLNLVGQMAAGIAHEIRNPLTTIRGLLQLLESKELKDKYKSYFSIMIKELDRTNSIITEFLSLTKDRSVETKRENLVRIVETLMPLISADALTAKKFVMFEAEEVPDLLLNEAEIRQLLLNLVRNGFDAMPENKKLTIRTRMEDHKVVLTVQDEGEGIKPEIIEKLGTPFLTTKDSGTGLGLAICHSIASHHNALITYDSSSKGTIVKVCFTPVDLV